MVAAMEIFARYDTPCELFATNEDGGHLTRREDYARRGDGVAQPPDVEIPDEGEWLWQLYAEIDCAVSRMSDGACRPIPPSEWQAWLQLTAREVSFEEWDILHAMDLVYCNALNADFAAIRQRDADRQAMQQGRAPGKAS